MQHSIFKSIIMGVLVGGVLFVASMILFRVLFFLLIGGLIFKAFSRHKMRRYAQNRFYEASNEEVYEPFHQSQAYSWASAQQHRNPFHRNEEAPRPIIIE